MALKESSRAKRKPIRAPKIDLPSAQATSPSDGAWLWLSALLFIGTLAFWPSLNGPFLFDDYHLPFRDPHASTAPAAFWIGGVRPVLMATYWANFLLSGTQPFSYHAGNLLLHAITAGIVFFVLRSLLDLAGIRMHRRMLVLFGTGLFLLHPLQTESVDYIAGRSEEVAGLFYLAAWLVFLIRFRSPTRIRTALAILLLAGAAVAGKESAISLPAILFLTDLYWNPAPLKQQLRSRLALYIPIVLGGALVAVKILRGLTAAGAAGFSTEGVTPARYALTQCRVIPTYIRLFLLPVGQNGDWGMPFFQSFADPAAWLWVLAMAVLVGVTVATYRRARLFSFGLIVFLVLLLPTSSIVPIKDAIAERRMYVPIIGLILSLLWLLDYGATHFDVLRNTGTLRLAMLLILVTLGALSFERSKVWNNATVFWADSVSKNPANGRAHMGLGVGFMTDGRYAGAVREFQTALSQDGKNDELTNNLAAAYQFNHQPELALDQYRKIEHPTASTWDHIGFIQANMGDASGALTSLGTAVRLDPNDATAYTYRGTAKIAVDDSAGARADLRRALELEPGNPTALKGLATLDAAKH